MTVPRRKYDSHNLNVALRHTPGKGSNIKASNPLATFPYAIMWFLGSVVNQFERKAPYLVDDIIDAVYSHDGENIIAGCSPAFGQEKTLLEVDRAYDIKWELGMPRFKSVQTLDYNPVDDKVLAGVVYPDDTYKVIEVQDGNIVNGPLLGTELGRFGAESGKSLSGFEVEFPSGSIVYNRADPTQFWVVDTHNHVVVLTDWSGRVHKQFGVYGVPGTDDTHLCHPSSVISQSRNLDVAIADYGNHRILVVIVENMSIRTRRPHPSPSIRMLYPHMTAVFSGNIRISPAPYPIPTYIYYEIGNAPRMVLPLNANSVTSHPKDIWRVLLPIDNSVYEINLAHIPTNWIMGWQQVLWEAKPAKAMVPEYSAPIVDWGFREQTINVLPTQAGTMEIQAARFAKDIYYNAPNWTGDWDTVDSEEILGGKATCYYKKRPLGVFRIKVTLKAEGGLNGWAVLKS